MLAQAVALSQSALSQHLAKMREEGIVTFRRESQTLWYRIADPRVGGLLEALYRLFCALRRGRPGRREVAEAKRWAPYRSVASWSMRRVMEE